MAAIQEYPFKIITAPAQVNSDGSITAGGVNGRTIWYDPNYTRILDDGRIITPDWTLAHELGHAADFTLGIVSSQAAPRADGDTMWRESGDPYGNPPYALNDSEAYATRLANQVSDEIRWQTGKNIGRLNYYWDR